MTRLSESVARGFEELIREGDTREIGKFLAFTTEKIIAPEWMENECGIKTISAPDEENQQARYDRLAVDSKLRIQVKFRGGKTLHMEQTRRTTGRNANGGAKNGQVRYSMDSFDVILFVIPNNEYEDPSNWDYLVIPVFELEDPQMPGYCVGRVSAALIKKYKGQGKEVLVKMSELLK